MNICIGSQDDETEDDNFILEPRTYEFPFSFTLPENVPASFEGPYGWIRYNLEVVVSKPFCPIYCPTRSVAEADIKVAAIYDLNNLDRIYGKVHVESKWVHARHDRFGCGYADLTFELERRAYVPGETVRFAATVDFRSSTRPPLTGVKVALIQVFLLFLPNVWLKIVLI